MKERDWMTTQTEERRKSKGGRPPKHETAEAGMRIIETATRLFASQGYAATSVEQIAAACGAGKDTIYRRFPSKIALFEGVVEHARARALEKCRQIDLVETDALPRLKRLMRSFLDINMEGDLIALKRIALSETVVSGRSGPIPSQPDPLMEMIVTAVATAQAEGALRAGDTRFMAAHLIHSLVAIPTTHAMLGGTEYRTQGVLDAHFDAVWAWLVDGVASR
jgi:TetR/AcrR family transcriptional regulator of autoinduction and epiphytic fitness